MEEEIPIPQPEQPSDWQIDNRKTRRARKAKARKERAE